MTNRAYLGAQQFKGNSPNGYTLIEVLVVLFIISIVTSVAMLTITRNENKEIESYAHEITQILSLAEEQAMLQPMVLGLAVHDRVLQFSKLQVTKTNQPTTWIPLADNIIGTHPIPRHFDVAMYVGDERHTASKPRIIISTNGEITPFEIYVGKKGKKPRYVIRGDADGNISKLSLI